jgi:hypothetical protein
MNIIENIVDQKLQDAIEQVVTSSNFPWYYGYTIDEPVIEEDDKAYLVISGYNPQQFVHHVISESRHSSEYFNLINDIINNYVHAYLKTNIEVKRAKFNMLIKDTNTSHHYPHVDIGSTDLGKIKTLLYYVSDSDGDTYFFNEIAPNIGTELTINKTVTPKKGTAVVFDSNIFHASSSPITTDKRIVLNIVFKILD